MNQDYELSEIPSSQRRPAPRSLDEFERLARDRNSAIVNAYRSGGYTLKDIGDHFGLHYSTVSGNIKQLADPAPKLNGLIYPAYQAAHISRREFKQPSNQVLPRIPCLQLNSYRCWHDRHPDSGRSELANPL